MKLRNFINLTFPMVLILLLNACESERKYERLQGFTMGTSYNITLDKGDIDLVRLQARIDERLETINQLMSTYIDDSELSLFNRSRTTECQPMSAETILVVRHALEISELTSGKFDVTLAPLIETWGFDKKETNNQIPSEQEIQSLLQTFGYDKITFGESCIAKQLPQLSINLSAIAKGYAVDQIAETVAAAGSTNYLVEIGGEVANQGVNHRNKPWRIAIESASTSARSIQRTLTPNGLGLATSGDYRNFFMRDGKRYSHTIDPTSGYPIDHTLASVTVLHPDTMTADAIATAMMVMGPEDSLQLADKMALPVFMLVKKDDGFIEVYSEAFAGYLE